MHKISKNCPNWEKLCSLRMLYESLSERRYTYRTWYYCQKSTKMLASVVEKCAREMSRRNYSHRRTGGNKMKQQKDMGGLSLDHRTIIFNTWTF